MKSVALFFSYGLGGKIGIFHHMQEFPSACTHTKKVNQSKEKKEKRVHLLKCCIFVTFLDTRSYKYDTSII